MVAVDAGSLGFALPLAEQGQIRHIFLSHTHMDHMASLPVFLENVFQAGRPPVHLWASPEVLASLRQDFFNDRVWAKTFSWDAKDPKILEATPLEPEQPVKIGHLTLTPVPVEHAVPTYGFVVEDNHSAVVISSDTGPTTALWECANRKPNLRAVFLESSFPNSLRDLAQTTCHLTPQLFGLEATKLKQRVALIAVHIKPRYRAEIIAELEALGLPELVIAQPGRTYQF